MKNRYSSIFYASIIGNILEYYDFTVYSVFSAVIGKAFFPTSSQLTQILASLTIFAIGFITRPVGGIIFGYIGDHWGRKTSLIYSMIGITASTLLMGLIPSYEQIGIYAPLFLALFRLIQGTCISGEGTGTAIFILEHYKLRPGLITGVVHSSNIAGTLLATIVGIIINFYSEDYWRLAFIFGGVMGVMGCYLRLNTYETPIFQELVMQHQTLKIPFLHILRASWRAIILTICTAAAASSVIYIIKAYIIILYAERFGVSSLTALYYMFYCSLILMLSMPLFGILIDQRGVLKVIHLAAATIVVGILPIFSLIIHPNIYIQLLGLAVLALTAAAISTSAYRFVISIFPTAERFSGVAFSYNLGIAIFGGTSPAISQLLVEKLELSYAPAFYIMATSSLLLLALYRFRSSITLYL